MHWGRAHSSTSQTPGASELKFPQISSVPKYFDSIFPYVRYVETIIAKCIDSYTAKRTAGEENIDKRLETIVDRMFDRCFQHGQYRQALGIAIETRRLDVFERAVSGDQSDREVRFFSSWTSCSRGH